MKAVIVIIKKEDFEGNYYTNAHDCAITRAIRRAGYTNLMDIGIGIRRCEDLEQERPAGYEDMSNYVRGVYQHGQEAREEVEFRLGFYFLINQEVKEKELEPELV